MLIASKFHRPSAPITLGLPPNVRTYFFVPYDPTNPHSEHVCEVADDDDIATLLSIKEGYHIAKSRPAAPQKPAAPSGIQPPASAATAPILEPSGDSTAGAATPSSAEQNAGAGADAGSADAVTSTPASSEADTDAKAEADAAAKKLHELSVNAFKAEIKKGGIPLEVLGAALAIEQSKPIDNQRETLIKLLTDAINPPAA